MLNVFPKNGTRLNWRIPSWHDGSMISSLGVCSALFAFGFFLFSWGFEHNFGRIYKCGLDLGFDLREYEIRSFYPLGYM
jgi:hypothetical protein